MMIQIKVHLEYPVRKLHRVLFCCVCRKKSCDCAMITTSLLDDVVKSVLPGLVLYKSCIEESS